MTSCVHCDETILSALFNDNDVQKLRPFCCFGCLTVFNIIHEKGLESYYAIKKDSGVFKRRSPVDIKNQRFQYLDDSEFLEQYSYKNQVSGRTMEFYLEGIHCLACLWLIEKLPEYLLSVMTSKLDIERSVVTVVLKEGGKFSEVARELNNLGYRPHPLKKNQDSFDLKLQAERSILIRIGLAGAAAGNIMIYAVSLYGGASDLFAQLFNWLTVIFAIPVLTYCAYPFYQNAWNALVNRTLSIDIPISLALLMGGVMGVYNLINGITENYFDSLTALVFLLLLSRYFLQKIQEKGLSSQDLHFFYLNDSVLKALDTDQNEFRETHSKFIKVGDLLKIRPGEFIPVDGIVVDGLSKLNSSLLTGESVPVKVKHGDRVYSGTQNLDSDLIIKTQSVKDETRLGSILKNVENGWAHSSKIVDLTSRVSKYFTLAVFFLSVIAFFYFFQTENFKDAFEKAITLLIVTCPCALALSTPLTFTRALSEASRAGIIIKNDQVIEKLSKVKTILLDKTGTITFGKMKISDFRILNKTAIKIEDIIYNLEKKSSHPVAVALLDFIQEIKTKKLIVNDFSEELGVGVSGRVEGYLYEINKQGIFENEILVATFKVLDIVRPDSKRSLESLKEHRLSVKILSGDSADVVEKIAREIGLGSKHALSSLSPERKLQIVESEPYSMMVGDGANDAMALKKADVGVAVLGAMDISLRAADVYMSIPGLSAIEKLITLSKETMKVIRRNLILSLLYNSLSVFAVFIGIINPLIAAIIMPLSSLTVLISTLIGTKKLRSLWK